MAFRVGLIFLVVALAAMATVAQSTDHSLYFGMGPQSAGNDLVSDAMDMEEEMMMESESARRQLADAGYISYGALARNKVPCNNRGQSYYNCRGHQRVNPYTRGCTRASGCARRNR